MDYRLLGYTTPELSPEARWLLLQWSKNYGLDRAVFGPRLDLYKRLGISPKPAKRGLDLLEKGGYVIREAHPQKRGRPTVRFRLSPRFLHQLRACTAPTTAHQPEIEELCRHAIRVRNEAAQNPLSGDHRANRLTPATYYLLAVLLAHAETPGIVRNVSYWWLQVVTGMTKERVISQLSKLEKIGAITHHEPGILKNGGEARMRSVYYLGLNHPLLLGKDATGLTAVIHPRAKPGSFTFLSGAYDAALVAIKLTENTTRISKEIETIASSEQQEKQERNRSRAGRYGLSTWISKAHRELYTAAHSLLPEINPSKEGAEDFLQAHSLGFGPIVKAHIWAYATMLLSNHWDDIEPWRKRGTIAPVMQAIRWDCSTLVAKGSSSSPPHSEGSFLALIYSLAHHIAVELQDTLKSLDPHAECDFSTAIFQIEPPNPHSSERWIVRALFRQADGVTNRGNFLVPLHRVSLWLPKELEVLQIQ
ncbi:hypothetical protein [Marinobacter flavimaris]|uniref:hypothetical protein n=1 Tax=Marinobacter flavimaris TaxID=262076 RepID=UPI00386BC315